MPQSDQVVSIRTKLAFGIGASGEAAANWIFTALTFFAGYRINKTYHAEIQRKLAERAQLAAADEAVVAPQGSQAT